MKNVERYLARGCERKMAEYFAAGRRRIVTVEPNDDLSQQQSRINKYAQQVIARYASS